jgi:hypothetical protein
MTATINPDYKVGDRVIVDLSSIDLNESPATIVRLAPENGGAILRVESPIDGFPRDGGFTFSEFRPASAETSPSRIINCPCGEIVNPADVINGVITCWGCGTRY